MMSVEDKYVIQKIIHNDTDENCIIGLVLRNNADEEEIEIDLKTSTIELLNQE